MNPPPPVSLSTGLVGGREGGVQHPCDQYLRRIAKRKGRFLGEPKEAAAEGFAGGCTGGSLAPPTPPPSDPPTHPPTQIPEGQRGHRAAPRHKAAAPPCVTMCLGPGMTLAVCQAQQPTHPPKRADAAPPPPRGGGGDLHCSQNRGQTGQTRPPTLRPPPGKVSATERRPASDPSCHLTPSLPPCLTSPEVILRPDHPPGCGWVCVGAWPVWRGMSIPVLVLFYHRLALANAIHSGLLWLSCHHAKRL